MRAGRAACPAVRVTDTETTALAAAAARATDIVEPLNPMRMMGPLTFFTGGGAPPRAPRAAAARGSPPPPRTDADARRRLYLASGSARHPSAAAALGAPAWPQALLCRLFSSGERIFLHTDKIGGIVLRGRMGAATLGICLVRE